MQISYFIVLLEMYTNLLIVSGYHESCNKDHLNKFQNISQLKKILKCQENKFMELHYQYADYWVLENYIKAAHGKLKCHESITMTINGDSSFLKYIPTLISRWKAPISAAIFAPGRDFYTALKSIKYIIKCDEFGKLVKKFVTFHFFFPLKHVPKTVPKKFKELNLKSQIHCHKVAHFDKRKLESSYKIVQNLSYPINVARNLARAASQTHFVFANDIELFPSLDFVQSFFKMIVRNTSLLSGENPRVFVIPPFEIKPGQNLPNNKTQLLKMIKSKKAKPFHKYYCTMCHRIPNETSWLKTPESCDLEPFSHAKRSGRYKYWEPFYIGTNKEPFFDERISWEGKSNKRIQNFAMCLLNYDYIVLNNAFLVHTPGYKKFNFHDPRLKMMYKTNSLIRRVLKKQFRRLYGNATGCTV